MHRAGCHNRPGALSWGRCRAGMTRHRHGVNTGETQLKSVARPRRMRAETVTATRRKRTETTMKSTMRRYAMVTGLWAITLGMAASAPSTAAETTLGDENVRTLLNTAVSYHYHVKVRRKTTQGACYFDPQKPTTMRCSWRWNNPGADTHRLRQKVKQNAVKWCKNAGGKSCIEFSRNGKLRYDGLSPEHKQRLEVILESIPSYDFEATPLPENATITTGLYHERFAQMQGGWEDWRKKRKSKRHYAMCANEQGTGARFTMQGGVKQLPHVREMCILQCQALAQWENTQGACHTIFENGEFTSTAAQRAMRLEVKPAPPETRDAFLGAWKAINHRGATMETVVKRVDADGRVAGTGCSEYPNGSLAWRTLGEATFVNGDRITLMNGKVRMTLMMDATHEGGAQTILTWPKGWQWRAPTQPMESRGCNERFTALATAGGAVERQPDDAPIVGAWSGKWKNGSVGELGIEAVGDDGALTGRYCTKTTDGVLRVWDIGSDGRFEATLGKKGKKALMTIPWGDGNRNELEFRMKGADKLTLKHKERAGTSKQKVTTLKMTRGTSGNGCLLRTTSLVAANEG